jgi:nucleoside-diphosphate-sugar epimerase
VTRSLIILGCGYTGQALGLLARASGWQVTGTGRTPGRCAALAQAGLSAIAFDGTTASPVLEEACTVADAIVCSIPADSQGDPAFAALEPVLRARSGGWTGYLSTTAVYGDRQAGWVFEDDRPTATSARALARLRAEAQWLSLSPPAHIFRLPGIYGPGRSALDKVRSGEARSIIKAGQIFSRCHRDDIAAGIMAALNRPHPGTVFNLCDDVPCPAPDTNAAAAGLLGLPAPPEVAFETADLSPMARQFYGDSKRVSNARAKAMLGWRPAYPSYREGLAAILAGGLDS